MRRPQTPQKEFRPDVFAAARSSKTNRCFEVEETISNNTLYKSLICLLDFLLNYPGGRAYLVVPDRSHAFATGCGEHLKLLLEGKRPTSRLKGQQRLKLITFEDVRDHSKLLKSGGTSAGLPRCAFLSQVGPKR